MKRICAIAFLICGFCIFVSFSEIYGNTVELVPCADGGFYKDFEDNCWCSCPGESCYEFNLQVCPPPISREINTNISVYFYSHSVTLGGCWGYTRIIHKKGIIEFDISSVKGIFAKDTIVGTLVLTVKSVTSGIGSLDVYDLNDQNENGIVQIADGESASALINSSNYVNALQPGDVLKLNVTKALWHDLFIPVQSNYSGFVIFTSGLNVTFYDHTTPEFAPRLIVSEYTPGDIDSDYDGICNPGITDPSCTESDNCPTVYNPDQLDTDGNGTGNACEPAGDFTYTESGGTITITKYTGTGGDVIIPAIIDGIPVVGIGGSAFSGCSSLASVVIPDGVTSIGNGAFSGCSGLTSVTIPDSITNIGYDAFSFCGSLTSVAIPDSVKSMGYGAFYYCSGLTSVTLGNSVTSIGNSAFSACTALTSMIIGNSVTTIGDYAFSGCTGLTSVTIPDSVTSIGYDAFYNCEGLTSMTIPGSVTSIASYAFADCAHLTRAYFSGNAPSMGSSVFSWCASNFSICYTAGTTGFTTPTWMGYPAAVCGETTSSTTTVLSTTTTTTPATAITFASFTAKSFNRKIILQWRTEAELSNVGFNLYRSESENGEYIKINGALISAQGTSTQGAAYEFIDKDVKNRKTYYYKLEDVDLNGVSIMHGPVSATPRWIFGIFRK